MRKFSHLILLSCLLMSSNAAFANYPCSGMIGYLGMESTGDVAVALSGSTPIHKICNIERQGAYTATPSACKAIYATLLASKLAGKPVALYYSDNPYSCNSFPAWDHMNQFYFVESTA